MDLSTYAALRTLASQAINVERCVIGLEHQIRRFEADGWPPAAHAWSETEIPALRKIRDQLMRQLGRVAKDTPLGEWQQSTKGLGPAVFLLLGSIPPLSDFTTVSKVWKYTGLDVRDDGRAPKRKAGERLGFSNRARSFALIRVGDPCIKHRESPYRAIYDARRVRSAEVHPEWTDGHAHADARRVMVKAIIRDAWRVSRGLPPRYSDPSTGVPSSTDVHPSTEPKAREFHGDHTKIGPEAPSALRCPTPTEPQQAESPSFLDFSAPNAPQPSGTPPAVSVSTPDPSPRAEVPSARHRSTTQEVPPVGPPPAYTYPTPLYRPRSEAPPAGRVTSPEELPPAGSPSAFVRLSPDPDSRTEATPALPGPTPVRVLQVGSPFAIEVPSPSPFLRTGSQLAHEPLSPSLVVRAELEVGGQRCSDPQPTSAPGLELYDPLINPGPPADGRTHTVHQGTAAAAGGAHV